MAAASLHPPSHSHAHEHDDDDAVSHCLGSRCFQRPHEDYVPPTFYTPMRGEQVPGRDFRWSAKLTMKGRPATPSRLVSLTDQAQAPAAQRCIQGSTFGDQGRSPREQAGTGFQGGNGGDCGGEAPRLVFSQGQPGSGDSSSGTRVASDAAHGHDAQARAQWVPGARAALQTRLAVHKAVGLPYSCGIGDNGRWRWQGPPLSFLLGAKLDCFLAPGHQRKARALGALEGAEASGGNMEAPQGPGLCSLGLTPSAKVLLMTPVLGNSLALKVSLDLLPRVRLNVRKKLSLGSARLSLRASIQPGYEGRGLAFPKWTLRLDWKPADSVEVRMQEGGAWATQHDEGPATAGAAEGKGEAATSGREVASLGEGSGDVMRIKYTKGFKLTRDCRGVVAGHVDVPTELSWSPPRGCGGLGPVRVALDSLRVTQFASTRAKRDPPKTVQRYLRASSAIGKLETIAVVPGHWIDPGFEPGAPGEREFNLEVANALERQLRGTGWEVLRPDRDAPDLQWEGYLNWVSRQTMRGVPVIEIHGQGSTADYRGIVLGVIGDKDAPLSKELAAKFGLFAMDWKELAVPRRGGVIVESFNSDEVLQMAPWHRTWAVNRLATRIASCVEKASAANRAAVAAATCKPCSQVPSSTELATERQTKAEQQARELSLATVASPPRGYKMQLSSSQTLPWDKKLLPPNFQLPLPSASQRWPLSFLFSLPKSPGWPFRKDENSLKWPWMN